MSAIAKEFKGLTTKDIVTWHRPIASAIIFSSFFTIWAIFVFAEYTLTTFLSRIVSILLIAGAAAAVTKRTIVTLPKDVTASMDRAYESVRPCVTKLVDSTISLFTWRDYAASAKFFMTTLVMAFLGNWMSDTTLMLVILIVAFTAPVAYEKKQNEIERAVQQVRAYADKYLGMIKTHAESKKSSVEQQLQDMERKAQ
ncbi:reticulon domain protein, 22 kDa potentially aggravating protein (paple22) [Leishmania major strain Friedlin]|uniref:Reticulon-like protein n=1 Tax=Leishmania major TaxID=5664 RepID=Q4Q737_LEIMA|nr:reticulon domain protein, 22 kDa potentially aggravating protein (paple22) [Leishmania major strain Friedlin]CAG9578492.1 reticulon_domain_protein_-_22_kDa_potentially_aggravating_protein_(paple22) [Leishmania major strain Friedlin]CAJ06559.1 reticulon domain protein, 22 kDa potentially aggravating protein (paple22) [Leishmania major strain Friedlin]|eukprot:XP_001684861.1 reticulon domain protein, 22 kDa potentially aggravating protein (paple22) [Leishmania major strain Friedlin]